MYSAMEYILTRMLDAARAEGCARRWRTWGHARRRVTLVRRPALLLVLALWDGNGRATELLVEGAGQCSAQYRRLGRDFAGGQVYQVSFVRLRQCG